MSKHILMTVNVAWNILNFRRPVVQALLDAGHRVTVLAPPDDTVAELQAMGCKFRPLKMDAKGISPLSGIMMAVRMHREFRDLMPDAILSYTIKNNIFGAMAARRLGIPFIPNVSGLGTAFLSGGALQMVAESLYRNAFRYPETVFFQNADDRDLFIRRNLVLPDQTRILPGSGIDLDRFAANPAPGRGAAPKFLMIARLIRDKGTLEYVDAARMVRETHPDAEFRLLGPLGAENRNAIDENTVRGWQDEGVVTYLGETDDVRPAIQDADCVVLPSYREGSPRTLIEAAAMARPVITTDVPGCRDVMDDGVTGLLCDVRDAESLADTCRQFIQMPPTAQAEMGQAGRHKMETEYDQKIVVGAYMAALRKVL